MPPASQTTRIEPSTATISAESVDNAATNGDRSEESELPLMVREGGDFKQRFDVLEELGKGRFGVVFKCVERETGLQLAAKIVKCIKSTDKTKVNYIA